MVAREIFSRNRLHSDAGRPVALRECVRLLEARLILGNQQMANSCKLERNRALRELGIYFDTSIEKFDDLFLRTAEQRSRITPGGLGGYRGLLENGDLHITRRELVRQGASGDPAADYDRIDGLSYDLWHQLFHDFAEGEANRRRLGQKMAGSI